LALPFDCAAAGITDVAKATVNKIENVCFILEYFG
jgi:hypothetical protein